MPLATIPDSSSASDYEDAAVSSRYISIYSIVMFSVQFLLICLAGLHKVIAWTAAATFVAWTWYFIDMHRIRYSHYG